MKPTRYYSRLDFNELSIIPQLSEIAPEAVDVSFKFASRVYKYSPFLPSPMDSVISPELGAAMFNRGGVVTLPTANKELESWIEEYQALLHNSRGQGLLGVLLPPLPSALDMWLERIGDKIDFVALDTLHYYPHLHLTAIKHLRTQCSDLPIISGNITERDGALRVIDAGVDAVRVGMTAASINQGQELTGCGRSQLAAVHDCSIPCRNAGVPLICDGGISSPDKAVKAFALGANAVMMGATFAATDESAAPLVESNREWFKLYSGMSMTGKISAELIAEGSNKKLRPVGSVDSMLDAWLKICKIAISRAGASSIIELQNKCTFELGSNFLDN